MSPDRNPRLGARYRVLGKLGEGTFGRVFRVYDEMLGREVALKRFKRAAAGVNMLEMLQQEFLVLARLRHPGVPRVYDVCLQSRPGPFFTMEYLRGPNLLRRIRGRKRRGLIEEKVGGSISAFLSVLSALRYLHSRGIVHGDVKPSNILYRDDRPAEDPGEGVLLVDFGLNFPRAHGRGLSGAINYVAPEQIRSGVLSPQTDLFSLGVVFYEVLCGENPFVGTDPAARAARRGTSAPRLLDRAPGVDPGLEEVVTRMLAPDPELRYRDAQEVQRDLLLAAGWTGRKAAVQLRRNFAFDPGWEGRREALEQIRQAIARVARSDEGTSLALRAAPGMGTRRLLRQIRAEVQAAGGLALTTSLAGKNVASLARDLADRLGTPNGSGVRTEARLRRQLDRALAEAETFEPGAREFQRRQHRVFELLVRWVRACLKHRAGSVDRRKAVWILEAVHAAEGSLVDLVRYLAHSAESFPVLLLLVGEPGGRWAAATEGTRRLELSPLEPAEIEAMVRLNLPGYPDTAWLAEALHGKVGGSLRLLELHVEDLVRAGVLKCSMNGWAGDPRAISEHPLPADPADPLAERLLGLSEVESEALAAGAVLGPAFDLTGVKALLGRAEPRLLATLDGLVEIGIVERRTSRRITPRFRFASPALASACESLLSRERLQELQVAAARHLGHRLEEGDEDVRERLAEVYAATRRPREAATAFEAAGDRLRRQLDPEGAYRLYRRAEAARRRARIPSPAASTEILVDLALALGRYGESRRHARKLLTRPPASAEERARDLLRVALTEANTGEPKSAARRFREIRSLPGLATSSPERLNALGHLARLTFADGDFAEAGRIHEEAVALAESLPADRSDALALALLRKGEFHSLRGQPEEADRCFRRCLPLCRSGRAGSLLPAVHLGMGQVRLDRSPQEAIGYLEKAASLARRRGDVTVEAWAHYHLGIVHGDLADTDRAREHYLRARNAFACGNRWEHARTEAQLGNLARDRGELKQAEEHYRRFREISRGMPSEHPSQRMNRINAWMLLAARGRGAEALRQIQRSDREFTSAHPRSHMAYLMVRAELESTHGRWEEARRSAAALLEESRRRGDRFFEAKARMTLGAVVGGNEDAQQGLELLREARHLASELGNGVLVADIDLQLARLALARPELGEDARAPLERAREVFVRGRLRPRIEAAVELAARVEDATGGAGARAGKELETLYRASEAIRCSRNLEELLEKLLDGAIELTQAERGLIFLAAPGSRRLDLRASRGADRDALRDASQISRSILRRALQDAEPIFSTNAMLDRRFRNNRSVANYGIRSFICAPLMLPDRALGTIYVDHRNLDNLFQSEDARFLMAYAGFGAAAVDSALQQGRLRRSVKRLQEEVRESLYPGEIIGDSPALRRVVELVRRIGPEDATVLIRGESGTGKELIARMLHNESRRHEGPFVAVNCAALPEAMVEAELLGITVGAATGVEARPGKFEEAQGGTLFLDEIGDLALPAQAKILRAIQERRIERVGSNRSIALDIRLAAATHSDLETAIREGRFREDLYYRLNVVEIRVPPLRDRREDIAPLVRHFVEQMARTQNRSPLTIREDVLRSYVEHDWPGNVRELKNAVQRATLLAEEDFLPPFSANHAGGTTTPTSIHDAFLQGLSEQELKRIYARYVYDQSGRSKSRTCEHLRIDFKTLRNRLQ